MRVKDRKDGPDPGPISDWNHRDEQRCGSGGPVPGPPRPGFGWWRTTGVSAGWCPLRIRI